MLHHINKAIKSAKHFCLRHIHILENTVKLWKNLPWEVSMPSFDVVSEINLHELTNAVDQTNREVVNRFDFKGSNAKVVQKEHELTLEAETDFQVKQMVDILIAKIAKRGIDTACLEYKDIELIGQRARQVIVARHGIDKDLARDIVKRLKDSKLKVQGAIQGDQVRITGKQRDDLQTAIADLRRADFKLPLQFTNFRD